MAVLATTDAATAAALGLAPSAAAPPAAADGVDGGGGGATSSAATPRAVRATCFATPPVMTAEVAAACAAYVDNIVYNVRRQAQGGKGGRRGTGGSSFTAR